MEITYYEMSGEDIPEIAQMELEYFSQPWSEAGIGHYMESGNAIFLAAKDNSRQEGTKIAGYAALLKIANEADLVSIAVREDYRRMGIATELLDIACDMARKKGIDIIRLEVRESNAAAIRMYEREGFERVGRRKGFYLKPAEDALLYTKYLNN